MWNMNLKRQCIVINTPAHCGSVTFSTRPQRDVGLCFYKSWIWLKKSAFSPQCRILSKCTLRHQNQLKTVPSYLHTKLNLSSQRVLWTWSLFSYFLCLKCLMESSKLQLHTVKICPIKRLVFATDRLRLVAWQHYEKEIKTEFKVCCPH